MKAIPTQDEYERSERAKFFGRMQAVERAPLSDRKVAREDWRETMADAPAIVGRNASWILNGSYGWAECEAATRIQSGRGNREAQLGILLAALDAQCPAREAAKAWKALTPAQQRKVTAALKKALKTHSAIAPD